MRKSRHHKKSVQRRKRSSHRRKKLMKGGIPPLLQMFSFFTAVKANMQQTKGIQHLRSTNSSVKEPPFFSNLPENTQDFIMNNLVPYLRNCSKSSSQDNSFFSDMDTNNSTALVPLVPLINKTCSYLKQVDDVGKERVLTSVITSFQNLTMNELYNYLNNSYIFEKDIELKDITSNLITQLKTETQLITFPPLGVNETRTVTSFSAEAGIMIGCIIGGIFCILLCAAASLK